MEDKPPQLTASPKEADQQDTPIDQNAASQVILHPNPPQDDPKSLMNLYPSTRLLTISDLESCVALENDAFKNPQERCTREKVSMPQFSFFLSNSKSETSINYKVTWYINQRIIFYHI